MHVLTIARIQWLLAWRSPEQLAPVLLIPMSAIIGGAIFDHAGRPELFYYSLVAVTLMSVAQTAVMTASELLVQDRSSGILEAMTTTPAHYPAVLGIRVLTVTATGLAGAALSYVLLRTLFAARFELHHPMLAAFTVGGVVVGSACAALLLAALLVSARSARAVQNSITGPMYLLAGVFVPVGLLSPMLEVPGKLIYLHWAAGLLRDAFRPEAPQDVLVRYTALLGTAAVWGILGSVLLGRLLRNLRRSGTLSG